MKTIYAIKKTGGQTCNKFFQYLYYLKKSVENNNVLYIIRPDITVGDYPKLTNNNYIRYPLYSNRIASIIGSRTTVRILYKVADLLEFFHAENFISIFTNGRIKFVDGQDHWNEDIDYTELCSILREIFELNEKDRKPIDELLKKIPQNSTLVAIHIRGGDYKYWRNGRYYFTPSDYFQFMKKIELENNSPTTFLISSNENIDLELFHPLNVIKIPKAKASQDLYAMSKCNYILGTVSTFSTWVSYLYQIPRYYFTDKDDYKNMRLCDFKPAINNIVTF